MTLLGPLIVLVLAVGSAASAFAANRRPQAIRSVGVSAVLIALGAWLALRAQLPLEFTLTGIPALDLLDWVWRIDVNAWAIGGTLLLALGASIAQRGAAQELDARPLQTAAALVLGAAALTALWAGSLVTLLVTWTGFVVIWVLAMNMIRAVDGPGRWPWINRTLLLLGLPIFFLWMAAATLPTVTASTGLTMQGWPPLARALLLLVSAVMLGTMPFHLWHPFAYKPSLALASMLHLAPMAIGGLLFAQLESVSDIGLSFALPVTLLALLGLLVAVWRAWVEGTDQASFSEVFLLSQGSIILLVGSWAGPEAGLAQTRVAILAGSIWLILARRTNAGKALQFAAAVLALITMAGMPLTAGFASLGQLFETFLVGGRWPLALAVALLLIPLIALAARCAWSLWPGDDWRAELRSAGAEGLLAGGALLILSFFLLDGQRLLTTNLLAWPFVLIPFGAGLLLARNSAAADELTELTEAALSLPRLRKFSLAPLRRAGKVVTQGLREAAMIFEGEGGLLWLLVFVVIFWLVR